MTTPEPQTAVPTAADSAFKLFNQDISIRAILAIMLTITVCFMHITGVEVKEPLYTLSTMAIGLYFGQKK